MNTLKLGKKGIGTIILAVVLGLLIGSFLSEAMQLLPDSVVKQFFTKSVSFGFGFDPDGAVLDFHAIKFKFGFVCSFTFMSLVGVAISLYLFRWYT